MCERAESKGSMKATGKISFAVSLGIREIELSVYSENHLLGLLLQ